jgi:DNA-binding SARP family transcriptional activator
MADMSTLPTVELGVLGPLQVRQDGAPVAIPGAKPRAILSMLGLHNGSVVPADTLIKLLWGDYPPRTAAKALQTHISSLRRTLGDGVVVTEGAGWTLHGTEVDASRYKVAAKAGRDAAAAGDTTQAAARFEEALVLWRGIPELPDGQRGLSEKTRWIESHAALVEDRADALLATGRAAEVIGDLEAAVAEAPLRERRWGQLMLALYRAGRQGEALGAYQRARSLLAEELGVDPGPELRRLENAIVAQDSSLDVAVAQQLPSVTRAVTFLLTDIEGSTAAWEADAGSMAIALARHDELVEQVVTSRGGRLIKTRGEGDATFSVFERPSGAASAAIELQDAIAHEPWELREPMRIRVALHTGEVELRDGDYFGRAVNRAARLRSLAEGGQILCSGATAELVIDTLSDDVMLTDLGMRQLKNLARPEHVFELRMESDEDSSAPQPNEPPMERPGLPAVLVGPGPFVGRGRELEGLLAAWQNALAGGMRTVLIAGEPGVGKTRLAGEWSQQAYEQGAVVLYGRCDEDLGAPYQPFAEALRALVPCVGANRLRALRGAEALLPLVPRLTDVLPDLASPTRSDPDTERYALFDAVVALLEIASRGAPIVLVLDDLHWAAKPTLLLLRHLLRFGDHARVQIVGTYRSTDLDRSHPLAAMLADLHRDGTANRLNLSGLDEHDVTAYVAEAGYDDEELAHALASVTGGNPFFLIEALRHVDESGGVWDQSTLPQGVREAVSRRLSRLPAETNKALAAAAVVGSRFAVELVERVVGEDLVDAFDEARQAGIVIEEPGGNYRFNHAIVRQSLLAELASVRRMRLHQRIATTLETLPGADDELLAELAHHYFECAWAGNAAKAVFYCRRAADQAMARLGYEGAADLYNQALHALEDIDEELPDRDEQVAELLVARCEALLAAGDAASAVSAVSQLQAATVNSDQLAAWATCFDGQLSMLIHPERLDEAEAALVTAAEKLAGLDDAAGEAKAHTVRAGCLARLGRIADCEVALDNALTAARRAREHRRVNAVLAGAPLAALWGPNPVPRAGGRCLDVVRLLRITTDSPAVEATSTRCQAVLEAFRGRAAAARRMIDSARRTVTELGLRHALLEVEQFAGIVELVVGDPAAAEPCLRKAYNGFRRMGLDADTAETAALLGASCLALGREAEADELCTESERLAGHALKPSIAWRTLRAQLLSRSNDHDGARRVAEAAVSLAERTDLLADHGDACHTLATVLDAAGDTTGARAAAQRAVDLYERKGASALAENARRMLEERTASPVSPQPLSIEPTNACVQAGSQLIDAVNREAWQEVAQLLAPYVSIESRRKIVGFPRIDVPSRQWPEDMRHFLETGMVRYRHAPIAVRGERLALTRLVIGTADLSSDAPQDEILHLAGLDENGRIELQVWFDVEDIDAAIAELDAAHARFEEEHAPARRLENAASQAIERHSANFAARDWEALAKVLADDISIEDRRRVVNAGTRHGRDAEIANLRAVADVGITYTAFVVIAARGERLILTRASVGGGGSEEFLSDALSVVEINSHNQIAAIVIFELDDFDDAIAELDARYLADEAAAHPQTWSVIAGLYAGFNRHERPATTPDFIYLDHRPVIAIEAGDLPGSIDAYWDLTPNISIYTDAVHRLSDLGAVLTHTSRGISHENFDAEWRMIAIFTVEGHLISRCEMFDETDLEAALARFDELHSQTRRLENAASQAIERYSAHFAARDWDALAQVLADDISMDDRRRVVNAGTRHGRDAEITNLRATADAGFMHITSVIIAARGERLILTRTAGHDRGSEEFLSDALGVLEINSHNQIATIVIFDLDDFDGALAELDARYLASEAAAHAQTWSSICGAFAAINRHELPERTPDWVNIDRRRGAAFATGEMTAYLHELLDDTPDINVYIEAVHRLSSLGAVVTQAAHGTSQQGFQAEWRETGVFMFDGDLLSHYELFDGGDLDAAVARFDQLSRPATRLENAASRAIERMQACFMARDWDALADTLVDDIYNGDHRRVVNAGIQHGRDAALENMRLAADLGITHATSSVIAVRGEHLVLIRAQFSQDDQKSEIFLADVLQLVETDADERIVAINMYDAEDFGPAIAELDSRYLAGEAADHAHAWSVITRGFAALNRRELPATTPDWVNIDHRRGTSIAPGEMPALLGAAWNRTSDLSNFIVAVHQLNNLGGVVTHMAHETSQEGFAEWRVISVLTLEGDLVNRYEVFDEADLEAALSRFAELQPQTRQLENAASRLARRNQEHFAACNWDAMTGMLADDFSSDDRRRVVNAGVRRGRDAALQDAHANADLGAKEITSTVIATRGERLVLLRAKYSSSARRPEAFHVDVLNIYEIDADERIAAVVTFDPDDVDAAIAELDARYVADEAAAHARTWSVIARSYAAFNRHELPPLDWVTVDHRRGTPFVPTNMTDSIRDIWDLTPDLSIHIVEVHRLSDIGAVFTHTGHGTSREGFDAEWHAIDLVTVDNETVSGTEVFDETDLDAAIARFDQLGLPTAPPASGASQAYERLQACFASRDWATIADVLADNTFHDDRRLVVGAGLRAGRDAVIAEFSALAQIGVKRIAANVIASRGGHLILCRSHAAGHDQRPDAFRTDVLNIVEINGDERIVALVTLDPDDFYAAIAELDALYLAGEAAPYARTWSIIADGHAALNKRELPPTTPDCKSIDHRRGSAFAPGELIAYVRAGFELDQNLRTYVEVVHRLSDLGAVCTHAAHGVSLEGFDAEWRGIDLLTVEGDKVSRCEVFEEADLNAAIARFEELQPPTPRPDNAASQVAERYREHFAAGDWDAMAALLADDFSSDDRRRVVGAGVRHGRDAQIADMRAIAGLWVANMTSTDIATRGERLLLTRVGFLDRSQRHDAFLTEVFDVIEIDANARIVASVSFDLDDIDAAFEELDARYIAGAAANHARTWSVITDSYAAINRGQLPTPPPDWADHRSLQRIKASDLTTNISVTWELIKNLNFYIEAVHRLSDLGAITTRVARGTSQEGLDAEWREVDLVTVEGGLVNRVEIFDEADLDAALARFEELQPPTRRLENTASRASDHYLEQVVAHDWDAIAEMLAEDYYTDDRRHLIGAGVHGREAEIVSVQVQANLGLSHAMPTVIAVRGERLTLSRVRYSGRDQELETFFVEILVVFEINADDRFTAAVAFDPENIDAAFEELDARYLAGEAAPHARTWSAITQVYAALNRHELPDTTPDFVDIDHRHLAAIGPGDLMAYLRTALEEDSAQSSITIETVHRLTSLGAVVTHVAKGTSREGFSSEWRITGVYAVEGDLINRYEIFEETDLDAALARFDALSTQTPRLENAASRVEDLFFAHWRAGDWAAVAEALTEGSVVDDRRRTVNAGFWDGRDVLIANMRALAEAGANITLTVIATRGERLALSRICAPNRDLQHGEFGSEMLGVVEINTDDRIKAHTMFDPESIDAAFEELDARYIAGAPAAQAHTWSFVSGIYAGLNRRHLPQTATDFAYIDHRPLVRVEASELPAFISVLFDQTSDVSIYMEAVHRLSDLGVVVTHTARAISNEDFDAEWRMINIFMIDDNAITRTETFDEADLDTALTRFDELDRPAPLLENTSTRVWARVVEAVDRRDTDSLLALGSADGLFEDRRKGLRDVVAGPERRKAVRTMFETVPSSWRLELESIAIRGSRLSLTRGRYRDIDDAARPIAVELLHVMELGDDGLIHYLVNFDPEDSDAALEELDARYLASEAAAYPDTWSAITQAYAAISRGETPVTTADFVDIDRRGVSAIGAGNLMAYLRAAFDDTVSNRIYVEAVHRLTRLGAVVTHIARGVSHEGLDAEWHLTIVITVNGNLIDRCEMFDAADLDVALSRFEELASE